MTSQGVWRRALVSYAMHDVSDSLIDIDHVNSDAFFSLGCMQFII